MYPLDLSMFITQEMKDKARELANEVNKVSTDKTTSFGRSEETKPENNYSAYLAELVNIEVFKYLGYEVIHNIQINQSNEYDFIIRSKEGKEFRIDSKSRKFNNPKGFLFNPLQFTDILEYNFPITTNRFHKGIKGEYEKLMDNHFDIIFCNGYDAGRDTIILYGYLTRSHVQELVNKGKAPFLKKGSNMSINKQKPVYTEVDNVSVLFEDIQQFKFQNEETFYHFFNHCLCNLK